MSLVTMREILPYAEEKKIAIPAFNIDTMEISQAILETVEEENCPAIIAVGQAAIKDGKLESLAATVRTLAKDMKTLWCCTWIMGRAWSRSSKPCAPVLPP